MKLFLRKPSQTGKTRVETKQRRLESRRKFEANEKPFRREHGSGGQRSAGVMECWSDGVLECWSVEVGVLSVGVLSVGVLSVGVLECWSVGVLECWMLDLESGFAGRKRSGDLIGGRRLMLTFSVPLGQFLHHVKQHRNQKNCDKRRRKHSADDRRSEDSP